MDDSEAAPTLRPRDVQARIRAGRSVEEVAAASGMPEDRVRRFAAPVLAEREFVAGQAMGAPVRRFGETSGHRKLRVAVGERLFGARVDADQVAWDAARLEDGRWAVKATYRLPDAAEAAEAVFVYDQPGRFSVAGNAQARWLLGEIETTEGEPTLRLEGDDDLAIMRSVNRAARSTRAHASPDADHESRGAAEAGAEEGGAQVRELRPTARTETPAVAAEQMAAEQGPAENAAAEPPAAEQGAHADVAVADHGADADVAATDTAAAEPAAPAASPARSDADEQDEETGGLDVLYDILDRSGTEYTEDSIPLGTLDATEPAPAVDGPVDDGSATSSEGERPSGERGADDADAEPDLHSMGQEEVTGVSDAAAVPQTRTPLDGDDPIGHATPFRDYPVEPSLFDDEDLGLSVPEPEPEPPKPRRTRRPRKPKARPDAGAQDDSAERGRTAARQRPEGAATATDATGPAATEPLVSEPAEHETAEPKTPEPENAATEPAGPERAAAEIAAPTASEPAAPTASEPAAPTASDPAAPPAPSDDDTAGSTPADAGEAKPAPKKRARKRATVPSWDEIMFGSPRKP